jgi:integrase
LAIGKSELLEIKLNQFDPAA